MYIKGEGFLGFLLFVFAIYGFVSSIHDIVKLFGG